MQSEQNSQAISLCKTNQQDHHQYQQNIQQNPESQRQNHQYKQNISKPEQQTQFPAKL